MAYLYTDEDNSPMTEENIQVEDRESDRECQYCANHDGQYCTSWDCKFVAKPGTAKNCHERCPVSKVCYEQYHYKGCHNPNYPHECPMYDRIVDKMSDDLPFTDPEEDPEGYADESDT